MNNNKIINILFLLLPVSLLSAQTDKAMVDANAPQIVFQSTVHDFGAIPYNGNATYEYEFTNKGKTPLVVSNCKKGCGCTSVSWTKEPVAPGQKGKVVATYNSNNLGYFNKGVVVYSNATVPVVNLRLIGQVTEPDIVAQNNFPVDGPTMIFEKNTYDLGKIKKGSLPVCEIKFNNTGKSDLQVINTIRNDGIKDIDINRQTINPGKSGSVKVTCMPGASGKFETKVFFYTNAGAPKVVHINGIVE